MKCAHSSTICPVAAPEIVARRQHDELLVHVHPVETLIHILEIRREEVMHAPVAALESCPVRHLHLLEVREQGDDGETALVGDVRRMESAASEPFPHAEMPRLRPPRALGERAELSGHGISGFFRKAEIDGVPQHQRRALQGPRFCMR